MKKVFLTLIIGFFSYNVNIAQIKPARILIWGLDGFSAEWFKQAKHFGLDKMVTDGVLSLTTRPVMPLVALPNWTSHLTGSGPEGHGITNNEWTF